MFTIESYNFYDSRVRIPRRTQSFARNTEHPNPYIPSERTVFSLHNHVYHS